MLDAHPQGVEYGEVSRRIRVSNPDSGAHHRWTWVFWWKLSPSIERRVNKLAETEPETHRTGVEREWNRG